MHRRISSLSQEAIRLRACTGASGTAGDHEHRTRGPHGSDGTYGLFWDELPAGHLICGVGCGFDDSAVVLFRIGKRSCGTYRQHEVEACIRAITLRIPRIDRDHPHESQAISHMPGLQLFTPRSDALAPESSSTTAAGRGMALHG